MKKLHLQIAVLLFIAIAFGFSRTSVAGGHSAATYSAPKASLHQYGVALNPSTYGVAVNPSTNKIYAANGWTRSLYVFDGASNNPLASIPVGTLPGGVAVNPNTNRVYVTNYGSNSTSVIDA